MNKQDVTTKLATTEASLKRWQTRLKRAATKVSELDRHRRRYQLMLMTPEQPVAAVVRVKVPKKKITAFEIMTGLPPETKVPAPKTNPPPGSPAEKYAAQDQMLIEASKKVSFDIPDFLDRSDPHIAANMTAARKAAEAEQRKKMPLTGKAALAKIREKK